MRWSRFFSPRSDVNERTCDGSDRKAEADPRDTATSGDPAGSPLASIASARYSFTFGADPSLIAPAPPEVERVESDMPILAHRIAKLILDGKRPFAAVNNGTRFGVDADAVCCGLSGSVARYAFTTTGAFPRPSHKSPSLGCTCGFYALPADIEPWDDGCTYLTLMVELSGRVIEHEKGYRAQHQRVVEAQLPECPVCSKQADVVLLTAENAMRSVACARHIPQTLPRGQVAVAIPDLQRVLRVPVTRKGIQ